MGKKAMLEKNTNFSTVSSFNYNEKDKEWK